MKNFIRVPVATLLPFMLVSCGVLEPALDPSPGLSQTVPLAGPTVTPVNTTGGKLVMADAGSESTVDTNADTSTLGGAQATNQAANQVTTQATNQASGLATGNTTEMKVVNVFQTDRCKALSRGGFIWFTNNVVLDDWLEPLDAEQADKVKASIDFSKEGALLLDYGVAASKGSGASIVGDKLELKGQEATVRVKQFKAPKTKRGVQVVTHPCSLYVMPRLGFSRLVVRSELDDLLTSFENK